MVSHTNIIWYHIQILYGITYKYVIETVLTILENIKTADIPPASVYDIPHRRSASVPFQDFYHDRLIKYMVNAHSDPSYVTLALALVIRATGDQRLTLSDRNIHRLFAASLLVATKFLIDKPYSNTYYAKVIGVLPGQLSDLEADLLTRLNFRIQTDCSLAVINRFFPPEALPKVSDITSQKIAQFVEDLHACRRQHLQQNQEQ